MKRVAQYQQCVSRLGSTILEGTQSVGVFLVSWLPFIDDEGIIRSRYGMAAERANMIMLDIDAIFALSRATGNGSHFEAFLIHIIIHELMHLVHPSSDDEEFIEGEAVNAYLSIFKVRSPLDPDYSRKTDRMTRGKLNRDFCAPELGRG